MDHSKAPSKLTDEPGSQAPALDITNRPMLRPDVAPADAPAQPASVAAPKIHPSPAMPPEPPKQPESEPATAKAGEAEVTRQDVRRERELQEYISSHKFYIPINAAARKRSLQISFGLVALLLVLAIVLIDLLLDSGAILLLQKIPHTHFFDVQN